MILNTSNSEEAFCIDHLLANNDPPSAPDLECVLRSIDNLKSEISDVSGRIALWTSQLRELERRLNQHNGVASAIRRMPEEVLGQIFVAYPFDVLGSRHSRQELVQLMLVCRGWRESALAAHRLWATVCVDGVDAARLSYDKTAAWLTRAGDVPRTLAIRMLRIEDCASLCSAQFTFGPPCILSTNKSLARLLSEGPSLQRLDMEIRHRRCLENFVKTLPRFNGRNVPHEGVKSLRLIVPSGEDDSDYTFLSSFPTLTDIRLGESKGIAALISTVGSLERLTVFYLSLRHEGDPPYALFVALSNCKSLKELHISIPNSFSVVSTAGAIVSLRKVTLLRVKLDRASHRSDGLSIINHLELPALTAFEIINARDATTTSVWEQFFGRHTSIKALVCQETVGPPLYTALNHLPLLTHFTMVRDTSAIAWLLSMSRFRRSDLQNEVWFPRLEHLELLEVERQVDLQYLWDFLSSRRPGWEREPEDVSEVADMKSVIVEFVTSKKDPSSASMVERLVHSSDVRELRDSGMKVTISSYRDDTAE